MRATVLGTESDSFQIEHSSRTLVQFTCSFLGLVGKNNVAVTASPRRSNLRHQASLSLYSPCCTD